MDFPSPAIVVEILFAGLNSQKTFRTTIFISHTPVNCFIGDAFTCSTLNVHAETSITEVKLESLWE